MAKTYEQFKSEVLGKGFDIDRLFPNECWDGAMYYSRWLGYPVFNCTVTGYVQDIWTQRKTSGILKYYDEVENLKPGDIVVFKEHPSTPLSHIAIFDHDAGGGFGAFLGQNQGAPNKVFNVINLPYEATYPTAFRPKCFSQKAPENIPIEQGHDRSVYRLYNQNSGDHLYTIDYQEAKNAYDSGWDYEGIAWIAPEKGNPVYRLFDGKYHLFTADQEEKNALIHLGGWVMEGIAFHSGGGNPIYRMYNPNGGEHILTASREEHDALSAAHWYCEGTEMKCE